MAVRPYMTSTNACLQKAATKHIIGLIYFLNTDDKYDSLATLFQMN